MQNELEQRLAVLERIKNDLLAYYPRALVLFGSTARYAAGIDTDTFPDDIDLLMVGGNLPPVGVESQDYGCKLEIHRLSEHQIVEIARSLRYDIKALALSKLYSKVLAKNHAIDVIAACLLLGPGYQTFGIEQIEIDGRVDQRDAQGECGQDQANPGLAPCRRGQTGQSAADHRQIRCRSLLRHDHLL